MDLKTKQPSLVKPVSWNTSATILILLFLLLSPLANLVPATQLDAQARQPNTTITTMQPALQAWIEQHPGESVRVMVQANGETVALADLVAALGGTVIHELPMIHAVAAEMPAASATLLATHQDVRWISLDAQVVSTAAEAASPDQTLRDEFSAKAYTGNNGTAQWSNNWQESGEADGALAGSIQVVSSPYCAAGNCLRWGGYGVSWNNRSLARQADLNGAAAATLSFSYRRQVFNYSNGSVKVEVSGNGGATWKTLATYSLTGTDYAPVTKSYDISAYRSATTQIRFTGSGNNVPGYFYIDNVEILAEPVVDTYRQTLRVGDAWNLGLNGSGIGVAVIDSGVAKDFDLTSVPQQVNFSTSNKNNIKKTYDTYGHGTHVAGIIAGNGAMSNGLYKGIAPNVTLYALKIADETGMAYESDTVAAMQWVIENRAAYNIRVVNLSVNSTAVGSYHQSPLNAAAEILWFNGIVVVVSAGNVAPGSVAATVQAAPANDPFVITVGATYEGGTADRSDDIVAPFSAGGVTLDGYAKPEIVAPGTDIVSLLAATSPWRTAYPTRLIGGWYFRLSGTSMSAPMVTGAVALLLQDEPNLTPDQVKYRLINSAGLLSGSDQRYLDVYAAVTGTSTESSNKGLAPSILLAPAIEQLLGWTSVNWNSVNWNSVNWNSVNWNSVNWNSVNWNSVNWNSVNWNSVNWNSATVTEIEEFAASGLLPSEMNWETPVWSSPDASVPSEQLFIPTLTK